MRPPRGAFATRIERSRPEKRASILPGGRASRARTLGPRFLPLNFSSLPKLIWTRFIIQRPLSWSSPSSRSPGRTPREPGEWPPLWRNSSVRLAQPAEGHLQRASAYAGVPAAPCLLINPRDTAGPRPAHVSALPWPPLVLYTRAANKKQRNSGLVRRPVERGASSRGRRRRKSARSRRATVGARYVFRSVLTLLLFSTARYSSDESADVPFSRRTRARSIARRPSVARLTRTLPRTNNKPAVYFRFNKVATSAHQMHAQTP